MEIVYSSAEGDSPSHSLESDAELKERAAKMKQEYGKPITLPFKEPPPNSLGGFLDRTLSRDEGSLFANSDHLVGTVEKTLSIFGFKNAKPDSITPTKRKVKVNTVTKYRFYSLSLYSVPRTGPFNFITL